MSGGWDIEVVPDSPVFTVLGDAGRVYFDGAFPFDLPEYERWVAMRIVAEGPSMLGLLRLIQRELPAIMAQVHEDPHLACGSLAALQGAIALQLDAVSSETPLHA